MTGVVAAIATMVGIIGGNYANLAILSYKFTNAPIITSDSSDVEEDDASDVDGEDSGSAENGESTEGELEEDTTPADDPDATMDDEGASDESEPVADGANESDAGESKPTIEDDLVTRSVAPKRRTHRPRQSHPSPRRIHGIPTWPVMASALYWLT